MTFGLRNIILVIVLAVLFLAIVIQMYVMYSIAMTKKYTFDSNKQITDEGVQAQDFWANYRGWFVYPTVGNLIGMSLLGVLFIMG